MRGSFKDLTGVRVGRLTVLGMGAKQKLVRKGKHTTRVYWLCKCDCGKTISTRAWNLTSATTQSCGCLQKETVSKRAKEVFTTHGDTPRGKRNPLYSKWSGILGRCKNKNLPNYRFYGGRGIKCLWGSYENFKKDMGTSFLEHVQLYGRAQTTIDRIDNNGHYSKENCRWATRSEQCRNYSRNVLVTYNKKTLCIREWAEITKIPEARLRARITKYNWPIDRALGFFSP